VCNLVIQSFGNEKEYRRAIFSILSFMAHTSLENEQRKILVFTDNVDFLKKFLPGKSLIFIQLTESKIREMQGKIKFLHRMKITVIDEAFQYLDGNLIYSDSDSFFTGNPATLFHSLGPANVIMHKHEYEFLKLQHLPLPSGEPFIRFYNQIISKSFQLPDKSYIEIKPDMSSWNAGVMMLHKNHAKLLPDVYSLTDQFYELTENHASEQFAFSVILQLKNIIGTCDSINYHYWYRTEKEIMDQWLIKNIDSDFAILPEDRKIDKVTLWTNILPAYINQHQLMLRDKAIQAFNNDDFNTGYKYAFRVLVKDPFSLKFVKDVLYHSKRFIFSR
jgi:hypothetical protein